MSLCLTNCANKATEPMTDLKNTTHMGMKSSPGHDTDSQEVANEEATSWTYLEPCVGWPNGMQDSSVTHAGRGKKKHFNTCTDLSCTSFTNNKLMGVTQLALTWVGWPNSETLASTCVQIWSRPKWAQVDASAHKAWPKEARVDRSFQLASACESVWPGL